MNKVRIYKIFDCAVIILEISYGVSLLMEFFHLIPNLGMLIPLVVFIIIVHLYRFGINISTLKLISKYPLFLCFFIILLIDVFQSFFYIGDIKCIGISSARLINNFFFVSYLYNLYIKNGYSYLLMPYKCYVVYNIVTIIVVASFIFLGVSWEENLLPSDLPLISDNTKDGAGAIYYFPYYLSIVSKFHSYSVLTGMPGITGLSHEPHVIMWIITPAFLFIIPFIKSFKYKYLFIFCFIFILLETLATIALICSIAILLTHLLWMTKKSNERGKFFLIVLAIILVVVSNYDIISQITDIIHMKVSPSGSDTGSTSYSTNMLNYIICFNDFFGYGNLPPNTGMYNPNIHAGFITGTLDVLLFFFMMLYALKLTLSKNKLFHFFGLGFLYFLMHGLKVNYLVFGYPFFAYILLILCILYKQRNIKSINFQSL